MAFVRESPTSLVNELISAFVMQHWRESQDTHLRCPALSLSAAAADLLHESPT